MTKQEMELKIKELQKIINEKDKELEAAYQKIYELCERLGESSEKTEKDILRENIAAEWVDKWQPEFDEHAEQKKGFAIPASEFPEDDEIIDMILENIVLQGQFCSMYDEEDDCYRFAYYGY